MTTITISLPDPEAAELVAQASAREMSLEAWVRRLAVQSTEGSKSSEDSVHAAIARIRELRQRVKPDPGGWTVRDYVEFGRQ
ncbi:MAG: hypothetical protein ACRD45_05735 [Bryobacteraceae bacterium]